MQLNISDFARKHEIAKQTAYSWASKNFGFTTKNCVGYISDENYKKLVKYYNTSKPFRIARKKNSKDNTVRMTIINEALSFNQGDGKLNCIVMGKDSKLEVFYEWTQYNRDKEKKVIDRISLKDFETDKIWKPKGIDYIIMIDDFSVYKRVKT